MYFNSGKYNPDTSEGKRLLAHELTHVVQQNGTAIPNIQKADLTSPRLAGNRKFENTLDQKYKFQWGSRGDEVRRLQQLLMDLGFGLKRHGTDGKYFGETTRAVKKFQKAHGLKIDGVIGFRTIAVLDKIFKKITLPKDMKKRWSFDCILQILCPWNKYLVEKVLPTYETRTFDKMTIKVDEWDGSKWVRNTAPIAGYLFGNKMGIKNKTCEDFASTVYHEGWHAIQGSKLHSEEEKETDAYISSEQWTIDVGISGVTFDDKKTGNKKQDLRDKDPEGNTIVDKPAARRRVRQYYGGIGKSAGERVIGKIGLNMVRVRKKNGSEYTRPAIMGDKIEVPGSRIIINEKVIDNRNWNCLGK